jgi:hypothetical protein
MAVGLAAALVIGCGGGSNSDDARGGATPLPGEQNQPALVRSCDSRVGSSRLPLTRRDLVLENARLYVADQHAIAGAGDVFDGGKRLDGKWRAFKTLVILSGPEATLRIPARERASFLLAYDPAHVKNFAYLRSDGQAAVRFVNCPRTRNLEFAGSLLARRPGCYHVQESSHDGKVTAGVVVNIAMGKGGCGETLSEAPRSGSALLSHKLPPVVRSDCRWLAAHTAEAVICPQLVPRGPTTSQEPYARGSYYSANFVSESIAGQKHLGHWSFEAGTPQDIRRVLRTNRPGPLLPFATLPGADVPIQLFRIGGYANIHQGHVVARWFCGGRAFTVSVHGSEHSEVVAAMARDLLRLVEEVESCGRAFPSNAVRARIRGRARQDQQGEDQQSFCIGLLGREVSSQSITGRLARAVPRTFRIAGEEPDQSAARR